MCPPECLYCNPLHTGICMHVFCSRGSSYRSSRHERSIFVCNSGLSGHNNTGLHWYFLWNRKWALWHGNNVLEVWMAYFADIMGECWNFMFKTRIHFYSCVFIFAHIYPQYCGHHEWFAMISYGLIMVDFTDITPWPLLLTWSNFNSSMDK